MGDSDLCFHHEDLEHGWLAWSNGSLRLGVLVLLLSSKYGSCSVICSFFIQSFIYSLSVSCKRITYLIIFTPLTSLVVLLLC